MSVTGAIDRDALLGALAGSASTGELAALFDVSRQAVHYHLVRLRDEGMARQVGRGRAARWVLAFDETFAWGLVPTALGEDEMWREVRSAMTTEFRGVSAATMACLDYGVTEMLNNAIDHSSGTVVVLSAGFSDEVVIVVGDDGVGAFRHVREHFALPSELDAVAHIAKGRQTTAPSAHTGQGLFFTSKVVDLFQLEANGLLWTVDNRRDDTAVGPSTRRSGTRVVLRTSTTGTRRPKEVFDRFSEPNDYRFDQTVVRVVLSDHGEGFVSRSEAKRLAAGLEGYAAVELDFQGVEQIGQGFVDELFRVWASAHPDTSLKVRNTSPEVQFMIERGLPRSADS